MRCHFEVGLRTGTEVLEAAARPAAYEIDRVDVARTTGTLLGTDRAIREPDRLEP